ncbi:MAG: site-specific DNA-methyltransferase [Colwellia sp.]|nr:site-specific DNA-methyltransferase [Colwellia sp.]
MRKIDKEIKALSVVTKEEWREYTKTVWSIANTAHKDHPAVFPVEIPKRLIKLFSFYGETVLDPFAGAGTTATAALELNRDSVLCEQNQEFVSIIETETSIEANKNSIKILEGDCRDTMKSLEEGSVNLVVTSPPYWNKADYGENDENIGKTEGYNSFLSEMKEVFSECYRVLEEGRKICVVTANVNQHTEHGLLTYPIASDFAIIMRDLGFVMVNEIIWNKDGTGGKWGSANGQRPIFGSYPHPPNFLFKNVHEYILIFAKPTKKKKTGKTVKQYEETMK